MMGNITIAQRSIRNKAMSEPKHEHFQPIVIHVHPVVLDDETAKFFPALQAAREACVQCPNKKPKKFKPLDGMQTK